MTTIKDQFLAEVDAFLAHHPEIAETTLGLRAVNSGKVIGRLREGGDVETGTVDRIRAFMRAYGRRCDCKSAPARPAA